MKLLFNTTLVRDSFFFFCFERLRSVSCTRKELEFIKKHYATVVSHNIISLVSFPCQTLMKPRKTWANNYICFQTKRLYIHQARILLWVFWETTVRFNFFSIWILTRERQTKHFPNGILPVGENSNWFSIFFPIRIETYVITDVI